MTLKPILVMTAPLLDPGQARRNFEVAQGTTVAEIVAQSVPVVGIPLDRLRVTLVTDQGTCHVPQDHWHRLRPMPGVQVVVRTIPGKDALRSVLLAVVSVAALYLAPAVAGLFGITSSFGTALVTAGLTIVGTLLVNALIPMQSIDTEKKRNVYAITGWQNELRPGAPVPYPMGKHRYAPPFAATSWTEIVGDQQYIRALFTCGYGPLRISDPRIGETSIDDYDDIDIEIREGRVGDTPVSLYPKQVLEEGAGVDLLRPLPRDDAGEIIPDTAAISTPIVRFSASDTAQSSVILGFPGGLFRINDDGDLRSRTVSIKIEERLNGAGSWATVTTLDIAAEKRETILRQHTWTHSSRGRWQLRITRMTPESTDTQVSDRSTLQAIQSIRPEYPINLAKPISLIAIRIRATYQLNGALDNFNVLIEREGKQHTGSNVWADGYSSNPATHYLLALTSPLNPYPVLEADIDMVQIADWFDWCVLKGLKYDRVHDQPESLAEMLAAICAAGRATPRHDGIKWGVVIDRPQSLVIDHINPRNSADFQWERPYFDAPDGFRVPFLDASNNYQPAERIIPWPGHVGDIDLTEELALPGKTDPDEIWVEARRRMYELIHRPDSFSAIQDGASRVVTRGDKVMTSSDVLQSLNAAARVKSVQGNLVEVDADLIIGSGFGMRFRVYANNSDQIGTSVVRPIAASSVETSALRLTGTGAMPQVGEAIHIGPMATESTAMRVRGVEAAEDFGSRLIMIADAPEIDTLTDAETPPAWDGRVGAEVAASVLAPATAVFQQIRSGVSGTGTANGIEVLVKPGSGSTATVTSFEIDHRLAGTSPWTTATVSAASAAAKILDYAVDDDVEIRARAIASTVPGNYTSTITITVGAEDPDIPVALDDESIVTVGSLGYAGISLTAPASTTADKVQIYRVPTGGTLDRSTHAVRGPQPITAGATLNFIDGDSTRTNLLADGVSGFGPGGGWSIAGEIASHAPGTSGGLTKSMSLTVGKTYRIGFTVVDFVAGTLTPKLTGGTTVSGADVASNGTSLQSLTSVTGNNMLRFSGDSAFDGGVTQLVMFLETGTCVSSGIWDYWIEPQNNLGVAGPVSGPFTVTIY